MKKITVYLAAMLIGAIVLSVSGIQMRTKEAGRRSGGRSERTEDMERENFPSRESADKIAEEAGRQDDVFYRINIQNRKQGNGIAFDGEYYYFRSQAGSYSLCRSRGINSPVEVVADEGAAEYLGRDLTEQDAYGVDSDGQKIGEFSLRLPLFLPEFPGGEGINRAMAGLRKLALEDRDWFFTDIYEARKKDPEYGGGQWYLDHSYDKLYVGDRYVSLYYRRRGYNGGIRQWEQSIPMTFDRETGAFVSMDQLFSVDQRHVMKRLTSAVYKFSEMERSDGFFGKYDTNVLVRQFPPNCFYLTPDGIVLCYERYSILPGAVGSPKFEIPYSWFEDLFIFPA